MLSDRTYMRDNYPRTSRSALTWLISAIIAGFILNSFCYSWLKSPLFYNTFAFSKAGILQGKLWEFFTYSVIHPAGQPHLLVVAFNLVVLYFLGRDLEPLLGTRRFLGLYAGAVGLGALAWLAANFGFGGSLNGSWSGIAALLTFFACLNANQRYPILLFFVMPVTIKPKYLVFAAFLFELCGLLLWEIRGAPTLLPHSCHLGGMTAGILYYYFVYQREWRTPDGRAEIELPTWFRKTQKKSAVTVAGKFKLNLTNREDLKAEVDRILDKINSEGFNSLTAEEKQVLDDAKHLISRP